MITMTTVPQHRRQTDERTDGHTDNVTMALPFMRMVRHPVKTLIEWDRTHYRASHGFTNFVCNS